MPLPTENGLQNTRTHCGSCIGNQFDVDACRALFHYTSPINTLIGQFKYGARLDIGLCFGHLLGHVIQTSAQIDELLIPVPMHFRRFLQRGFNQAWELTRQASKISGVPAERRLARKIHFTSPQSEVGSKLQRSQNVRNSFAINQSDAWNGVSQVTIIDDVVTTMSTVSALAKCLKNQGIQRVEVLCVARAGF